MNSSRQVLDDKVRSLPAVFTFYWLFRIKCIDICFWIYDDNREADEHSSEWKTETGEDFTQ